jgi:hypothetical protein
MVIRTQRDFSRKVDEVGVIALPYLVFAEDKFRARLSEAMAAVVHDYLRFNTVTLQSLIDRVMDMIEEYRHSDIAGTDNIQTIDMYASELSTQEDRFKQLNEKVDALIKKSQYIKKGESKVVTQPDKIPDRIPVITSMLTENLSPETPIESSRSDLVIEGEEDRKRGLPKKDAVPEFEIGQVEIISSSLPIEGSSLTICPSCGKSLKRSSYNNIDSYHCYTSKEGCGKIYVLGVGNVFVEKTSIKKQSNLCQCGLKLNGQGKKEIDGELYQIYACKSPDQGGCGTGYIMDKDGDLHVGRGKIALSRPKISK